MRRGERLNMEQDGQPSLPVRVCDRVGHITLDQTVIARTPRSIIAQGVIDACLTNMWNAARAEGTVIERNLSLRRTNAILDLGASMMEPEYGRAEGCLACDREHDNSTVLHRLKGVLAALAVLDEVLQAWSALLIAATSAKGLAGDAPGVAIGLSDSDTCEIGFSMNDTFLIDGAGALGCDGRTR